MSKKAAVVPLKPRKPRNAVPDLDLAEMYESPSMKGMLSFLDIKPEERRLMLERREASLAETAIHETGMPVSDTGTVERSAETGTNTDYSVPPSESGTALTGMPVSKSTETGTGQTTNNITGTPEPAVHSISDYDPECVVRMPIAVKAKPWVRSHDAHTPGEQIVYSTLWNHGRQIEPGYRKTIIGIDKLARLIPNLARSNIRISIDTLIEKLAIENRGLAPKNEGRIYIIYDFARINERRRAAGLTHVVRIGRAVRLASASGVPVSAGPTTNTGMPVTDIPVLNTGMPVTPETGMPVAGPPSIVISGERSTTTNALAELAALLASWIHLDDQALTRIWEDCRKGTPDCTPQEIALFASTKRNVIESGASTNPSGLLITNLPKFFENGGSAALHHHRQELRRRSEQEALEKNESRKVWTAILEDPASTERDKEFAQAMLTDPD